MLRKLIAALLGFALTCSFAQTQLTQQQINVLRSTIKQIHTHYIQPEKTSRLFNDAMQGMLSTLDPHSTFLDAKDLQSLNDQMQGQFAGIGVEVYPIQGALKVITPIDGSPAAKARLKAGDIIIKVNGSLIQHIKVAEAIQRIKGKPGSKVHLTILRKSSSEPIKVTLTRAIVHVPAVSSKLLLNHYAYIRISMFGANTATEMRNEISKLQNSSKLKGLILDLRNNPGGLLSSGVAVANSFLSSKKIHRYHQRIVYTKGRDSKASIAEHITGSDMLHGLPMVVLINQGTASAAEIVTGALQDYRRAVIMGETSFGKGSVQTLIPVGKHSAIKLTTALYYTPAGREIQARGIEPDIIVPNLSVKQPSAPTWFSIDEADFTNHLKNKHKKQSSSNLKREAIKLARTDYPLYQATIVLRGINRQHETQ